MPTIDATPEKLLANEFKSEFDWDAVKIAPVLYTLGKLKLIIAVNIAIEVEIARMKSFFFHKVLEI